MNNSGSRYLRLSYYFLLKKQSNNKREDNRKRKPSSPGAPGKQENYYP
jgi:hypothetical protein